MVTVMYVVVGLGLLASVVLLALGLRRGRSAPGHRGIWILGLVAVGLGTAFHVVVSVAGLAAGGPEFAWVVVGTLALIGVLAVAVIQPRWAGWALVASAVLLPVLVLLADLVVTSGAEAAPPLEAMLGFYSVPALVSGAVLILSTTVRHRDRVERPGGEARVPGSGVGSRVSP